MYVCTQGWSIKPHHYEVYSDGPPEQRHYVDLSDLMGARHYLERNDRVRGAALHHRVNASDHHLMSEWRAV